MPRGPILHRKNLTRDTLVALAATGALTVAAAVAPHLFAYLAKTHFNDTSLTKRRARAKKLRELERRNLIDFKELKDGSIRIELTHRGETIVRRYQLDAMKLAKPKRWDGMWRIVIYDIPVRQKRASDAFREKLKQLGLFMLQRSVWVSPYECLPEIEFLAAVFGIDSNSCICYLTTKKIPKEYNVRNFFDLPLP